MSNMYKILKHLCDLKGITVTEMCRVAGVPRSSVGNLATGSTQQLSAKNVQKLANFFNISTDYLLGNEQEKPAAKSSDGLSKKENRDIAKKVENLMQELTSSGDLMFDGDPMTEEAQESLRNALTLGYELARQKNKEKYTPKKYRK